MDWARHGRLGFIDGTVYNAGKYCRKLLPKAAMKPTSGKKMTSNFLALAAASACLLIPLSASAGVNKCVDAAGVVSYSDRPCEVQGQKQAEVKDTTGFALMAAQENRKKLIKTCTQLQERRSQCYSASIDQRLGKLFSENCEPLVKAGYRERERERYRRYQNGQNDDEMESEAERTQAKVPCEKLPDEMYKVLKENFSAKLTPEDVKAIEYSLLAVPGNGYEPAFSNSTSPYRKRRR